MTELFENLIALTVVLLCAFIIGKYSAEKWNGNKTKVLVAFLLVSFGTLFLLWFCFGRSILTVKGMIVCLIFLFASYGDIKSREAEDYIHIMIAITAFIGFDKDKILPMFLSSLLMALIFLLPLLTMKSLSIGAADIKFSLACALLLGYKSILGLMIGLFSAILINLIRNRKKAFPLLPYLSAGYMTAYFL